MDYYQKHLLWLFEEIMAWNLDTDALFFHRYHKIISLVLRPICIKNKWKRNVSFLKRLECQQITHQICLTIFKFLNDISNCKLLVSIGKKNLNILRFINIWISLYGAIHFKEINIYSLRMAIAIPWQSNPLNMN